MYNVVTKVLSINQLELMSRPMCNYRCGCTYVLTDKYCFCNVEMALTLLTNLILFAQVSNIVVNIKRQRGLPVVVSSRNTHHTLFIHLCYFFIRPPGAHLRINLCRYVDEFRSTCPIHLHLLISTSWVIGFAVVLMCSWLFKIVYKVDEISAYASVLKNFIWWQTFERKN